MMSTPFLTTGNKTARGRARLVLKVGRRPNVTAPKFGRWLELQRGRRSLEAIAIQVRPLVARTGMKVSRSLILKLEQGQVPNWPMLAALSRVYDTDIRATVLQLLDALECPGARDLFGRPVGVEHASTRIPLMEGGAHAQTGGESHSVPTTSDVGAIERATRLRELSDQLRAVSDAIADEVARRQAADLSRHEASSTARPRTRGGRLAG